MLLLFQKWPFILMVCVDGSRTSSLQIRLWELLPYKHLTIIGGGWANYRDFSVASRSVIRLRNIIDRQDTDKSQYFAITEFNNCFIIRSPSLSFIIIFGHCSFDQLKMSNHSLRARAWFQLRMSRILFAAKHNWTVLHMSRPFCVGSYQFDKVMWCVFKLINDLSSSHCRSTILPTKHDSFARNSPISAV